MANTFLNPPLPQVESQAPSTLPFVPFFAEIEGVAVLGDMSMFMPGGAPHP